MAQYSIDEVSDLIFLNDDDGAIVACLTAPPASQEELEALVAQYEEWPVRDLIAERWPNADVGEVTE